MLARLKQFFNASTKPSAPKKDAHANATDVSLKERTLTDIGIRRDEETGNCVINVPDIRSVGIRNLTDVTEHNTNYFYDTVSHIVRFKNGGLLRFAYANSGELIELYLERLSAEITANDEILVSCLDEKMAVRGNSQA